MQRDRWRALRAGIVTGASDADPSAIVTCTQVGASTGYGLLWLFPFTTAGLIWLESLAARIGIRRGRGIATLLSERFGAPTAWAICSVFIGVNVVNLAADVAGATSILNELTGIPQPLAVIMAAGVPAAVLSFGTFSQVRRVLLFLTPLYLLYALAAVAAHPAGLLQPSAFVPRANIRDLLFAGVGLAGAILTPYVFFWQVEDTAQRERRYGEAETEGGSGGMIFANIVLLFVVLMAAATLHSTTGSGLQLATLRQASDALRPLLGRGAFVSFSAAILASELIAAPVIAAVCGYVVANLTQRRAGLSPTTGEDVLPGDICGASAGRLLRAAERQPGRAALLGAGGQRLLAAAADCLPRDRSPWDVTLLAPACYSRIQRSTSRCQGMISSGRKNSADSRSPLAGLSLAWTRLRPFSRP